MKPTLLLLAGMLNDERVWQPVAQRLRAVCEVRIAHFPTQESMTEMAQDAWQLVADLPSDQPLALAGFSMGGYVLQQMLAEPQRAVQAVALIDSSIRPETEASRANRGQCSPCCASRESDTKLLSASIHQRRQDTSLPIRLSVFVIFTIERYHIMPFPDRRASPTYQQRLQF